MVDHEKYPPMKVSYVAIATDVNRYIYTHGYSLKLSSCLLTYVDCFFSQKDRQVVECSGWYYFLLKYCTLVHSPLN